MVQAILMLTAPILTLTVSAFGKPQATPTKLLKNINQTYKLFMKFPRGHIGRKFSDIKQRVDIRKRN